MTPNAWFDNENPGLRRFWHPVAACDELDGDGPRTETTRLGFTLADGTLTLTEQDAGVTAVFTLTM